MFGNSRIDNFEPLAGLTNMKDLGFIGLNINDDDTSFLRDMKQMEVIVD